MQLNTLSPAKNSKKSPKRLGRGHTRGKTCGRGHKGYKSRSGSSVPASFEGGQTPLYRRLPKRGFTSLIKKNIAVINLSLIQKFSENKKIDLTKPIDLKLLQDKKIINKRYLKLKILGDGDLKSKISITTNYISKQAKTKIEKIGGSLNILKNNNKNV